MLITFKFVILICHGQGAKHFVQELRDALLIALHLTVLTVIQQREAEPLVRVEDCRGWQLRGREELLPTMSQLRNAPFRTVFVPCRSTRWPNSSTS